MPKLKYDFDVTSIGDATLDTFVKIEDATVLCNLNKDLCWLCLNYADKIPVQRLDHSLGGNACNLAVGSARLGLKTAIYSVIGDDDTANRIWERFKSEGVNLAYMKRLKRKATNYSVIVNFRSQRTILSYHVKRNYCFPKLPSSRFIYLTSMGEGCEKIYPRLLKYIKKNKSKLCFGPGTYQRKSGFKTLEKLIHETYLFISNKEEAISIFDPNGNGVKEGKAGIKQLLHRVFRYGPELVVITDGNKGAYAHDGKKYYYAPIINVPVLEPTGAGDSFSTGLISALALNKEFDEALRWATFNSTSVIQKIGAQAGLLDSKSMKTYLRKYRSYKVKSI